jgi:hypothetical protein
VTSSFGTSTITTITPTPTESLLMSIYYFTKPKDDKQASKEPFEYLEQEYKNKKKKVGTMDGYF